jgi:HEAT repeat protein
MLYAAVVTIGEIGPSAKEAVPDLRNTLTHRELFVRKAAALTLKRVDPAVSLEPTRE